MATTSTITRTATWNKVGTDIRKATSVKEALQISGLDYTVVKTPIFLGNGSRIPNQFATKKAGTNEVLGIVGKDYTVVQNEEAFDFVNGIISEGLTFEKAGETSKMNYIIASLPEQYILDDKFKPYIIFQNSHNGATTLAAAICSLRIICQNQFTRAFRTADNKISLRHSVNITNNLAEAQEVLKFQADYMDTFKAEAEEMALTKVSTEQVNKILDKYFIIDEAATEAKAIRIEEKKNIFLNAYNSDDNGNFRGTVWGMLNAFTDFNTHMEPTRTTDKSDVRKFVKVTFKTSAIENFLSTVNSYI